VTVSTTALCELAGFEVAGNFGSDLLPEIQSAFRINAFVADYGELLNFRSEEDEDAVSFASFVHAELQNCTAAATRVSGGFSFETNTRISPEEFALGLGNCGHHFVVVPIFGETLSVSCYQPPLAPPPPNPTATG
jgi:hypothetical protein